MNADAMVMSVFWAQGKGIGGDSEVEAALYPRPGCFMGLGCKEPRPLFHSQAHLPPVWLALPPQGSLLRHQQSSSPQSYIFGSPSRGLQVCLGGKEGRVDPTESQNPEFRGFLNHSSKTALEKVEIFSLCSVGYSHPVDWIWLLVWTLTGSVTLAKWLDLPAVCQFPYLWSVVGDNWPPRGLGRLLW